MQTANLNGTAVTYKYNADGLRSYKKVGSTVHEYEYSGDKLVYEKRGDLRFYYRYDAYGELASIKRVEANGTEFPLFVINNSRGDVEELRKMDGTLYARYVYDSWGNTLHIYNASGTEITDSANLAKQNPIRYRGYYFDAESGLYYLQSRYYDPVTGRFVNPDTIGVVTASEMAVTDKNLYAYCGNNPVMRVDVDGEYWETAFDIVSLAASAAEVVVNPTDIWAWGGLAGDILDVALPFVGGIGEVTRSLKIVDKVTDPIEAAGGTKKVVSAAERSGAVKKAWKNEFTNVKNGGRGISRAWSLDEMDELLTTGKVKGYQGHHMKSVKGYPELAGESTNIQFLKRSEHLAAHGGNWKNVTHGRYNYRFKIDRLK